MLKNNDKNMRMKEFNSQKNKICLFKKVILF